MTLQERLTAGKPLLLDGAMGTLYAALPKRAEVQAKTANLLHPEEILEIHRQYLQAGAEAIKTNTFSLSEDFAEGNAEAAEKMLAAAVSLAKQAAQPFGAFVFADISPTPAGNSSPAEIYCRQIDLFLAQGLTAFLIETLPNGDGIAEAAQHLKEARPEAFLLVSFAVAPDGMTREGRSGRKLAMDAAALPTVDAVGFNCVSGPRDLCGFAAKLPPLGKPLAVQPNAGYPAVVGRRTVYQGKPHYFAERMTEVLQAGASIVGGCCGTTPAHIAALAAVLENPLPKSLPHVALPKGKTIHSENPFWEKLSSGKKVIAVEIDPPKDDNIAPFLEDVQILRSAGADVVTIADCPIGRPRADSSLLAAKLKRELGIEPLPHMTCRDRNRNATKALLLGLSMEDVHNVLIITGDPVPTEARDEVKAVFNFNSRMLARYIRELNESTLNTPFHVFGALNLNARNFDVQLRIAKEKEEAGMCGFLTQPVLSSQALENLKRAKRELNGKILGGIFPVISYKNACFLNNEVNGMRVSDEIIQRYEGKNRAEGEELAVEISADYAVQMADFVDGFYLMTPSRRTALMQRIMEKIREI